MRRAGIVLLIALTFGGIWVRFVPRVVHSGSQPQLGVLADADGSGDFVPPVAPLLAPVRLVSAPVLVPDSVSKAHAIAYVPVPVRRTKIPGRTSKQDPPSD